MTVIEHRYTEEFWGTKVPVYEYEYLFEDGEIYDEVARMMEEGETDEIPQYVTLTDQSGDEYEIEVELSQKDRTLLEKYLEELIEEAN